MARAIASKGPSLLVLIARSTSKAEAVSKQLGVDFLSVKTRVLSLDLSSQKSVRQAATELENITKAVDVLINNAGVMAVSERTLSKDGEDIQFATNYSPQSGARTVNITSAAHVLTHLRFSDHIFKGVPIPYEEQPNTAIASQMDMPELDPQGGYHPMIAYCHSNTVNMLFTTELAEMLKDKGIYPFTSAPGVVETEL
ncbi:hypothetical protein HO133_002218 [Letharia lupina]|uniref:NAD(P)-binding protein n=1 Tax=Letharia lupina TaxID=560253 RepID=A0A8H6CDH5_9LECA|nr:uncharacterized protein HO133_002218 [Letharia lupina]KAF6221363.1 hypothetical protein HO133_002218 [Letharia lupina]